MRNKLLLSLSALLIVVAFSCKNKAGKSGLLVPNDAIFVMHINSASLTSKLSWEEIKQSGWFTKMAAEKTDSFSKKILDNPEASGVDMKGEGFTLFVKRQNGGGYYTFQGALKDAAAFEQFLKQTGDNKIEVAKSGDLSYAKTAEDVVVSWNASRFIVTGNAPLTDMNPMRTYGGGSSARSENFGADSLLVFAKNTYALSGDELLDNNAKFTDLMKSSGDAHFFISVENLYGGFAGGMMSMMKISDLMKDNIATATLSFDNGKITVDGHQYLGKAMADIMNKYPPKDVSRESINRLPSGDVLFAMSINYPIEGLVELFKLSGMDGLANGALGEKNLTVTDFANALTGETLFTIPAITEKNEVVEYEVDGKKVSTEHMKTDISYIGGLGIKDQKTFDKIYAAFMDMMKNDTPKDVSLKNENKWMVFGNTEEATKSFLAGNNKPAYADKLSGHFFGMYFNINKMIGSASNKMATGDSTEKAMTELSLATWQDGTMYGDYKNGETTFKMEVNLSDKNTNSLKQINSYADKMSALSDMKKKRMEENWPTVVDTTVVAPMVEQK